MLELLCSSNKIDRFLSWLKKLKWQVYLATSIRNALHEAMSRVSYEGTPFNYQILLLSFCQQKTLTLSWWKTSFCLLSQWQNWSNYEKVNWYQSFLFLDVWANMINLVACLLSFKVYGRSWAQKHKQDEGKIDSS